MQDAETEVGYRCLCSPKWTGVNCSQPQTVTEKPTITPASQTDPHVTNDERQFTDLQPQQQQQQSMLQKPSLELGVNCSTQTDSDVNSTTSKTKKENIFSFILISSIEN